MKKVEIFGKSIWIGRHPNFGILIYDSQCQKSVNVSHVRLFVVEKHISNLFDKEKLKIELKQLSVNEDFIKSIREELVIYVSTLNNSFSKCFKCEFEIISTNFSFCKFCKQIKCGCGACKCKRKLLNKTKTSSDIKKENIRRKYPKYSQIPALKIPEGRDTKHIPSLVTPPIEKDKNKNEIIPQKMVDTFGSRSDWIKMKKRGGS